MALKEEFFIVIAGTKYAAFKKKDGTPGLALVKVSAILDLQRALSEGLVPGKNF